MQFDREKLKAVILYTCRQCGSEQLGAVKLHKVLYFSDMLRFVQVGAPITGSTYRKRPLGPTCDQLLSTLRELERTGALKVEEIDYFGYLKKQYTALVEPEKGRLSADEIALLDEVIDFVCRHNTAKTISEFSHNKAWELAEYGDVLPYSSAFRLFPTQVSEESLEWAAEQERLIAAIRSERGGVAVRPFRDLRARILEKLGGEP